jgi:hypothetical protein
VKTRSLAALAATTVAAVAFTPSLALAASSTPHGAVAVHSSAISKLLRSRSLTTVKHTTSATTGPITVNLSVSNVGALSVSADATASTDSAGSSISSISYDFGDGTTPVVGDTTNAVKHQYAKAGTYTITVTVKDSATPTPNSATASTSFTTMGSDYTAYGPTRILDTRNGTGTGGTIAKVPGKGTLKLKVAGAGPTGNTIPAGVTAVVVNLTVTNPESNGFITAYDDGDTQPTTSNVNYAKGQTIPDLAVVPVGADGYIDLYNAGSGATDLVADVSGYFTATAASQYVPITDYRLLDTRDGTGTGGKVAKVGPNGTLVVTVAGADNNVLPAAGITAVALNLTVTNPSANGFLTAYGDGTKLPNSSNVNYAVNETVPNEVIVPVGTDGKIDITNTSIGSADVVADVSGYFTESTAVATSAFVPVPPTRILDTRSPDLDPFSPAGPLLANSYYPLPIAPAGQGFTGAVLNATVTNPQTNGFIELYPYNNGTADEIPNSSNVNYGANQTVANLTIDAFGTTTDTTFNSQDLGIANVSNGKTDLILDATGYFLSQ